MNRPKKRVAEKILELGLIRDKKELRKKRAPRGNRNHSGNGKGEGYDSKPSRLLLLCINVADVVAL